MAAYGTTYLVLVEVKSPGHHELEDFLVELATRYEVSWQLGPREGKVSSKVAKLAALQEKAGSRSEGETSPPTISLPTKPPEQA